MLKILIKAIWSVLLPIIVELVEDWLNENDAKDLDNANLKDALSLDKVLEKKTELKKRK